MEEDQVKAEQLLSGLWEDEDIGDKILIKFPEYETPKGKKGKFIIEWYEPADTWAILSTYFEGHSFLLELNENSFSVATYSMNGGDKILIDQGRGRGEKKLLGYDLVYKFNKLNDGS